MDVAGRLFVVATPIGNRGDIAPRAVAVLRAVDWVAAEDTRHSGRLLQGLGIQARLLSLHEHNEARRVERVLGLLRSGKGVALVSDAGTPLISDPGYRLVHAVRAAGHPVVPVPGPSALTAALSVAGLPTDRFAFEGFLPPRSAARRARLEGLRDDPRTLVFYESPRRLPDTLRDLVAVFGGRRPAALARELTKLHEEVVSLPLAELPAWLAARPGRQKGEFVVLVGGAPPVAEGELGAEERRVHAILARALPPSRAAALAAEITGRPRRLFYGTGGEPGA